MAFNNEEWLDLQVRRLTDVANGLERDKKKLLVEVARLKAQIKAARAALSRAAP